MQINFEPCAGETYYEPEMQESQNIEGYAEMDLDDEKWIWMITDHDIAYVFSKPYLITLSELSNFVRLQCVSESSRASWSQTTRMEFEIFLH